MHAVGKATRAGKKVSSYTAEVVGLEAAVDILESNFIPRGAHVGVFTDSQSCLSAFGKGVRRQTDARISRLWQRLLNAAKNGLSVTLQFIYAHAGTFESDEVDGEASTAAKKGAETSRPQHVRDIVRQFEDEVAETANKLASPTAPRAVRGVPCLPAPWTSEKNKLLNSAQRTLICQLRTDACPRLGGHLVAPHNCVKCGTTTHRASETHQSMATHMFTCSAAQQTRRTLRIRGVKDLWKDAAKVILLVKYFVG